MAQESGKSPQIKWEDNEWSITLPSRTAGF